MLDATLIIVNHNGGAELARCLDAVRSQTCPARAIVLVDNASTDGSAERVAADYPEVTPIRSPVNLGFAAANNLAARQAPATRWIVTLNPDAFPRPDWLERLARAAAAPPGYGMYACQLIQARQPALLDGAGDVYHVTGLAWRRGYGQPVAAADRPAEVFGPCAAAAMYRRDAFLAAGGFDTDFFCYMEDVDLAFRLRLRGERCLYVPEARVLHVGSGVTGYRSDFSTYHGHRNMVWVFLKNMPAALLWRYLPGFLFVNTIALFVGLRRGQFGVIARAKYDALRGIGGCWRKRRTVQSARWIDTAALRAVLARGWRRT